MYIPCVYRLKVIVSNIISILASIWGRLPFWLIFKRFCQVSSLNDYTNPEELGIYHIQVPALRFLVRQAIHFGAWKPRIHSSALHVELKKGMMRYIKFS